MFDSSCLNENPLMVNRGFSVTVFNSLVYFLFQDVLIVVYDLHGSINLTDINRVTTIYLNARGHFDATLHVSIATDKRGCSAYSSISSDVNLYVFHMNVY